MNTVLEIDKLTKKYGSKFAVKELSIKVEKGNIYGILGPNGSGKTTTLGIILGVIKSNSGSFKWFEGVSEKEARKKIGSILETPNFYPYLSAVKNLEIVSEIKKFGKDNIDYVLKQVNLYERRNDAISKYSLGMKQRLSLAASLLSDPDVLVLDEPTNGLDPQGIADVRSIIKKAGDTGKTIIMASHILDEVEKICSHVAVIKNGNLLASGNINEVLSKDKMIEISSDDLNSLEKALSGFNGIHKITKEQNKLLLYVEDEITPTNLNEYLFKQDITLSHLLVRKKSLESTFLELIGKND